MKLQILALGKAQSWINEGVDEYARRMPQLSIELIADNPVRTQEQRMLERLPRQCTVVVLDERGREFSSMALGKEYERWQMSGTNVCLLIGGADGFSDTVRERADMLWSLSRSTFPHALVRVMVCEQLYRAWSIVTGHPYHRA